MRRIIPTNLLILSLCWWLNTPLLAFADDARPADHAVVLLYHHVADNTPPIKTTLLGTTSNYVITYDHKLGESTAYYVEAIQSIKKLKSEVNSSEKLSDDKRTAATNAIITELFYALIK